MNKRRFLHSIAGVLLLAVIVAGWFATHTLGDKARQEIVGESRASAEIVSTHISFTLDNLKGAVKSLAGSPWIAPALSSRNPRDIEHANSVLDRYNSALNASVSYLMDDSGMTIASSNRNDRDSFVGNSYRIHPYFQEGINGRPGHYFAMGITSGKRGFYFSHPVKNDSGIITGVVAMKKNLDDLEQHLKHAGNCFLVNRDGVILLSSEPSMALKILWPLEKAVEEKLISSRQFGDKPLAPFLKQPVMDGRKIAVDGETYIFTRTAVAGNDGWSIVLLAGADRIKAYESVGILAASFLCFLIMFFTAVLHFIEKAHETTRKNDHNRQLLLNSVREGIFGTDTTGKVTFINTPALDMLGFSEDEILWQDIHTLIHHSHEDGSDYPLSDCPMHASYTNGIKGTVEGEVLWKKDGSHFPVDYSHTPIIENNRIVGSVIAFRDITERKEAERARRENEERRQRERHRLKAILDTAQDGFWLVDASTTGIIDVNEAACSMLGYTRDEMLAFKLADIDTQLPAEEMSSEIERIKTIKNAIFETHHRTKDGRIIEVEISVNYLPDANQFFSFIRNITGRKKAENALRESEERYYSLFENAMDGMAIGDPQTGELLNCNKALCRMVERNKSELVGQHQRILHPPEQLESGVSSSFQVHRDHSGQGKTLGDNLLSKSGKIIPVEISGSKIRINERDYILGIFRDITKRKETEKALQESEEKFRTLFATANDAIFLIDYEDGVFLDCNPITLKMFRCTREQIIGQHPDPFFPDTQPDGRKSIEHAWKKMNDAIGGQPQSFEWQHRRYDGTVFDADVSLNAFKTASKQYIQAIVRDITERKRFEEQIQQMAYHDFLTGLPNRKLFSDRLDVALANAQRNKKKVGIGILDLDKFKDVNDSLGHGPGDAILKKTAERLLETLRKGDTVARIGGDEFVLLLPDLESRENATRIGQKIVDAFQKTFSVNAHEIVVTTSIGITVYPDDGTSEDMLLQKADIALYQAKDSGRNRCQVYRGE